MLSQVLSAGSVTPSWAKMRSGVRGITKPIITATRRTHSARVYSTVARRGLRSSSRPRIQGWVTSMYLLQLPISFQISCRALENWKAFTCSSTRAGVASARSHRGRSMLSSTASIAVMEPPKYFSIMATVRETRLPRSLARSALMRVSMALRVNSPSEPKGISRMRK